MCDDQKRYEICQGENPVLAKNVYPDANRADRALKTLGKAISSMEKLVKDDIDISSSTKWHRRFLKDALGKAEWSKDPSTKCGAVIVDKKQRIISSGYNGFPRGIDDTDERLNDRDTKYALTIHAEVNAILFSKVPLDGMTLYVGPIPPCVRCAVQIIQSGISTVVSMKMSPDIESRWGASVNFSKSLFIEAGVEYIEIYQEDIHD